MKLSFCLFFLETTVDGQRGGAPGSFRDRPKVPINSQWQPSAPGVSASRVIKNYSETEKQLIFEQYQIIARIPHELSLSEKISRVADSVDSRDRSLTNELISLLEDKMKTLPNYFRSSGKGPIAMSARNRDLPNWVPKQLHFGHLGSPGEKQDEIHIKRGRLNPGSMEHFKNIEPPGRISSKSFSEEEVLLDFAQRFGYTEKNAQIAENSIPGIVRKIQKQYGLRETGILDQQLMEVLEKPRCGKADFESQNQSRLKSAGPAKYQIGGPAWPGNTVSYSMFGYSNDLPIEIQDDTVDKAFHEWEKVANLRPVNLGPADDSADIKISFGRGDHWDGYPFDGQHGTLAHAFFNDPGYPNDLEGDAHFDEDEFWTLGEGRITKAVGKHLEGGNYYCKFPFSKDGIEHRSCLKYKNTDFTWCSLTYDYDRDKKWGFCGEGSLYTYGGNAEGEACNFPFDFQGKTYNSCTTDGRTDGYLWCSPDRRYEDKDRYGFCPAHQNDAIGGNANGKRCHFPFIFQSNTYSSCTTVGRTDNLLWCATTDNYDSDGEWGFCDGGEYSLFLVAVHEFGHSLGLGHSNNPEAVMYPSYHFTKNFKMPADDIYGIQQLYGPPTGTTRPTTTTRMTHPTKFPEMETTTTRQPTRPTRSTTTQRWTTRSRTTYQPDNDDNEKPNNDDNSLCDGDFDSILQWGSETFIFKGRELWRITGEHHFYDQKWSMRGPLQVESYWAGLPSHIDAVYMVPDGLNLPWSTGNVRFFSGAQYWEYNGNRILPGFPKSITELGLPRNMRLTAAINRRTGKNDDYRRFTYLIAGRFISIFDEKENRILKRISTRRLGIPGLRYSSRIKAAFEGSDDGYSFFFVNDLFYAKLDGTRSRTIVGNIEEFVHCCGATKSYYENGEKVTEGRGGESCYSDSSSSSDDSLQSPGLMKARALPYFFRRPNSGRRFSDSLTGF